MFRHLYYKGIVTAWLAVVSTGHLPAQQQRFEFKHPQMGTVFKLVFYASDSAAATVAARDVFDYVDTLNAHMSDYLPESNLNRLCAVSGKGIKTRVPDDLWDILKLSVHFSAQSDGAFDITVGPVTRLWRRARNLKEAPDSTRIREAVQRTGYQNIRFYNRKKKIELTRPGMQLDLGGIAPGYAADACLRILKQKGIKSALADAGGDIALGDPPPGEKGWTIATPDSTLILARCGITTSGATSRFLETEDGKRYSHIVDPRTGWGLSTRNLVTVQAPNATIADAWATALSVLGPAGWTGLKKNHPELKVWIVEMPLK